MQALRQPSRDLAHEFERALAEQLPLIKRDGGFVREGYDSALDETRSLRDASRLVVAAMQARYADDAGIKGLKIRHNNVLGYFVEVTAQHGDKLMAPPLNATFIHRQTLAGQVRFTTQELGEIEARIANAGDRALGLELEIFERLNAMVTEASDDLRTAAHGFALLDVATSLAKLAIDDIYVRPEVDGSLGFAIEGGRHPVVEQALQARRPAVHRQCLRPLAGTGTGLRPDLADHRPEHGGQIHLPAPERIDRADGADRQFRAGSTRPHRYCRPSVLAGRRRRRSGAGPLHLHGGDGRDRGDPEPGQRTRAGDPRRDRPGDCDPSTACRSHGQRSSHLHESNRCRALFATHYHELTALSAKLPRLFNATVRVKEWQGDVVFLHEVLPGSADRSYGIQVAKLAGLPAPVIARAKSVLAKLEAQDRGQTARALADDLPLFAVPSRAAAEPAPPSEAEQLIEAIKALHPDEMSPREALDALYALRAKLPKK